MYHLGKVFQDDPLRLVTAAITDWARDVTNVLVTLAVFSFSI